MGDASDARKPGHVPLRPCLSLGRLQARRIIAHAWSRHQKAARNTGHPTFLEDGANSCAPAGAACPCILVAPGRDGSQIHILPPLTYHMRASRVLPEAYIRGNFGGSAAVMDVKPSSRASSP